MISLASSSKTILLNYTVFIQMYLKINYTTSVVEKDNNSIQLNNS